MSGSTIYPTFSCFDDAIEFFGSIRDDALPHVAERFRIVHGIIRAPSGARFAHGWVEERIDTGLVLVWQGGLLDGVDAVWYAIAEADFKQDVEHCTRYTVPMAAAANRHSGHFGPWRPEYRALAEEADQAPGRIHGAWQQAPVLAMVRREAPHDRESKTGSPGRASRPG